MWTFDKIQLANYVTWKELDFEFKQGTTFLTGNNFSGKSVTVSPLFPILLNEGTIPQGSTARFFGQNDDKSYMFEMVRSTKTSKYNICENEVDLAIHKIATAQKFIRGVFNISSDLFSSTIFVNGRKDHALASGKPSTRLDYLFNTLVSSDVYSQYSPMIEKLSKSLAEKAIELRTLKDLLSKSKSDKTEPSDFDVVASKKQLADLNKRMLELSNTEDFIRKAIELQNKPKVSFKTEAEFKKELSKLRKKLVEVESYEKDRKKFKKVQKALAEFKELKEKLNAPDKDYETLAKGCKKQKAKAREALDELREQRRTYKEQSAYRDLANTEPTFSSNRKKVERELELINEAHAHAKSIAIVEGHDENECPICKSKVDMSKIRSKSEKLLRTYPDRKQVLEDDLAIIKARSVKLVESVSSEDIEKLEAKIEDLDRFGMVCAYLDEADTNIDVNDQDIDSETINDRIEILEAEQNKLLIYASRVEREKDNPFLDNLDLDEKLEKVLRKKKAISSEVANLSETIPREEYKKEAFIKWERQNSDLRARVKELAIYEKDIDIIKGLKKAFSRDGFRLHKLEQAASLFVSNLNSLAPLIVQEPMKFEAAIDKRKCDIIATRNNKSSTIFSLSGAESQIFKMVSALALIRCLPSHLRADTIILDEVEANCDDSSATRYARDFIPELQKSVDKILVISPKSLKALPLQPDHAYKVVKKAGRSSLETL